MLLPAKGSRVGETNDFKLLDFALTCLNRFEEESGVSVTTGQDLGHGVMSDGKTTSLEYMSSRFHGCINADTSKPTGEGNFRMLEGCLRGSGISTDRARVLLIGYGNIGFHLADRLKSLGTQIEVVEPSEKRAKQAIEKGFKVHSIDEVAKLLADSFDAVALNANGNSLTSERVAAICNNNQLKIICGCENLVFAADANETPFTRARKIFTPTEMCGMMGYLTAVEEYLRTQARSSFSIDEMYTPAKRLEEVGYSAAKSFWGSMQSFEQCVRAL